MEPIGEQIGLAFLNQTQRIRSGAFLPIRGISREWASCSSTFGRDSSISSRGPSGK